MRRREALHARSDIDGLAEIILPFVEHDGQAWAFMDADLDHEIVAAALLVQCVHGGTHPKPRNDRVFRLDEGRHHGIADRLHHGAFLGCDDFQ